jgi:hypothetical protein
MAGRERKKWLSGDLEESKDTAARMPAQKFVMLLLLITDTCYRHESIAFCTWRRMSCILLFC